MEGRKETDDAAWREGREGGKVVGLSSLAASHVALCVINLIELQAHTGVT